MGQNFRKDNLEIVGSGIGEPIPYYIAGGRRRKGAKEKNALSFYKEIYAMVSEKSRGGKRFETDFYGRRRQPAAVDHAAV